MNNQDKPIQNKQERKHGNLSKYNLTITNNKGE